MWWSRWVKVFWSLMATHRDGREHGLSMDGGDCRFQWRRMVRRKKWREKWRRDERVGFLDIWGQNRPKSIYPNASHVCNACVSHLALKWTEMGQ